MVAMADEPYRYSPEDVSRLRAQVEILDALHRALERWPEIASLSFEIDSVDDLAAAIAELLEIDAPRAEAVLSLQVRRAPRAERERIGADLQVLRTELAKALAQGD